MSKDILEFQKQKIEFQKQENVILIKLLAGIFAVCIVLACFAFLSGAFTPTTCIHNDVLLQLAAMRG